MTNAEKYLKDGKVTEELIGEIEINLGVPYYVVANFWNKQIKRKNKKSQNSKGREL